MIVCGIRRWEVVREVNRQWSIVNRHVDDELFKCPIDAGSPLKFSMSWSGCGGRPRGEGGNVNGEWLVARPVGGR
jgi:hypothetical protein